MNGKLPSMFACFLPYGDSHRENIGKKIGWKILPKDGKRIRPIQIFGIWAVRELPFHLRYRSFACRPPLPPRDRNWQKDSPFTFKKMHSTAAFMGS